MTKSLLYKSSIQWFGVSTAFVILSFCTPLYASSKCVECHVKGKNGPDVRLIDLKFLKNSVHRALECIDCHEGAGVEPHTSEKALPVNCGRCHVKYNEEYKKSIHGQAQAKGIKDAPSCSDCHGTHGIRAASDPLSSVNRENITQLCLKCHIDSDITAQYNLPGINFFKSYQESAHYKIKGTTLQPAAVCSDCHGSHTILPADDPFSFVNRKNIPSDCGKCHSIEKKRYSMSIHWKAFEKGIKDAPVCTDCHGEHTILDVQNPNSQINPVKIPYTCARCHESLKLSEAYRIPPKRLSTYFNTYHGIAIRFGDTTVANCASCHGYHEILPASDPRSPINPANLVKTCSRCHPGANENFAKGRVHVDVSPKGEKGVFAVRVFYIIFISVLCAGFLFHVIADILRQRRESREGRRS